MPTVVCPDCNEERELVRVRKNTSLRCHKCAQAIVDKRTPKKEHFRICIDCGDKKKVANKTAAEVLRCRKCNDIHRRESTVYIRVCIDCGNEKEVNSLAHTKSKRCNSCAVKKRHADNPKPKKVKKVKAKRKPSYLSKKAIEKIRLENKKFREEAAKAAQQEVVVQRKTDEEMIAEFLRRKNATVS
jgi:ribosomal protein S27E